MKFRKGLTVALAAAAILFGCRRESSQLEYALALAGDNRGELEWVLEHYADDPQKLAAARFLIENMPGHYSIADTVKAERLYDALDSLINAKGTDCDRLELQAAIVQLCNKHGANNIAKEYDIRLIKADFLIRNIDRAFEQWRTVAWCRNLNFDRFCEYLLPYKVAETQKLSEWWAEYDDILADSLERISSCSLYRISSFHAAEVVNEALKRHFSRRPNPFDIPPLFYRPLTRLRVPYGACDELCNTGLSAFRAAGIPVTIDYTPLWGYGQQGHTWGVIYGPNGKDMPIVPIDMSPYTVHKVNETMSKVYRRTYARNDGLVKLNSSGEYVPPVFRNVFQRDVTPLYVEPHDITVEVDAPGKYVYLCTTSRTQWQPIAYAEVKDGKAKFSDVGRGIICMVVAYDERGKMLPLTEPLKFDRDGSLSEIVANSDSLMNVRLFRKSPLLDNAWVRAVKMEHGEFEAADDPSFRHAVKAGEVNTPADQSGEVKIDAGAHRYWRYVQRGDSAICCIGEITMISDDEIVNSKGRSFGNSPGNEGLTDINRAFDGDVLTAVTFGRSGEAWVGLDFGEPVKVDKIRYSPRSDGNMIEPGDEYELKYWHKGGWQSLGTKVAETVSVEFEDVPSGALFILLNNTKGNSVRIFLIDADGRQEWW